MAADACGVCFYAKADANGVLHCAHDPPQWQRGNPPYVGLLLNWPIVEPSDWCGQGYNTTTNQPMAPGGAAAVNIRTQGDQAFTTASLADVTGMSANLAAGAT